MVRLGLCCQFQFHPIKFRTTTVTYVKKRDDPLDYLGQIVEDNADSLMQAVETRSELGIGSFLVNSRFCPVITHPEVGYTLDDLPNSGAMLNKLD